MRMTLTYRQKFRLKKTGKWLLILLLAILAALIVFLLYVERYVVYTDTGAHIDYHKSSSRLQTSSTSPAASTEPLGDVEIVYEEPSTNPNGHEPASGYFITTQELSDTANLLPRIEALDAGSTVMLELKDDEGRFYYPTSLSNAQTAKVDLNAVSQIITTLRQRDCTVVASIPAFSDNAFALENPACALPLSDGSLWTSGDGFYWLDPADDTVIDYLEQIMLELSSMNISEVVFTNFYFPDSQSIDYDAEASRPQITAAAAKQLSSYFSGSNLTVSFATDGVNFPMEGLSGRLFIEDADAAQLERFAAAYGSEDWDAAANLVFLTSSKDSRFDAYTTLRPLP